MKNIRSKRLFHAFIASGLFLFMLLGCSDDFFNQTAGDRITPDLHYKSLEDVVVSMRGAIIPLQDVMPRLIVLDGLRSDQMVVTGSADLYFRRIFDQNFTTDNPYIDPSDLYKVIININEVLANIDKVEDRRYDAVSSPQIKGALIGMRAWSYFTIAKLYGQVAYITDNYSSLPANFSQNMMTKEAIIDTLINQLKPYIHDATQTQYEELRYQHYINNKALLGELYLEKNDYANAVAYLKLACESFLNTAALFKVDRSYQNAAWSSIFLNAESQGIENIAVIPYSSRENQDNPLAKWTYLDPQVRPSKMLVDSFMLQVPPQGNTGDLWRGHNVSILVDTLGMVNDSTYITETTISKYAIDRNDPLSSDIIISRAADIHLLLAEALNRLGDETSQTYALVLINNGFNSVNPKPPAYVRWASNLGVRGRVYLRPRIVPADLEGEARTLYIEDLIMAERAMELAFEGKRWNDLVRVANRRNDPAYLADKVAEKHIGTAQYDLVKARLMNPANWYLPFE